MSECKTLYVSDLDGTLLNHDATLSDYTKNTLNKLISYGIDFTVATGRTTDATIKIMEDIHLNTPIISFHGAIIYDVNQNSYIKVYKLAAESVNHIITALKSHGVSALMYELKDDTLIAYYESLEQKHMYDFVEDRKARFDTTFEQVNDFSKVSSDHIMYFALGDTYERIKPVYDELKKL
ncbi:HAD family hydrolase, partial [Anaerosporobacter sp.]